MGVEYRPLTYMAPLKSRESGWTDRQPANRHYSSLSMSYNIGALGREKPPRSTGTFRPSWHQNLPTEREKAKEVPTITSAGTAPACSSSGALQTHRAVEAEAELAAAAQASAKLPLYKNRLAGGRTLTSNGGLIRHRYYLFLRLHAI